MTKAAPISIHQKKSLVRRIAPLLIAAVIIAPIGAYALKGAGIKHRLQKTFGLLPARPTPPQKLVPVIINTMPADAATGIDPTAPLYYQFSLPNGPIDPATVSDDSIGLFRFDNRERVPTKVRLDGDKLVIEPVAPLEANRNYRLQLSPGLKDVKGNDVKQSRNTLAFFTSAKPPAGVAFQKVIQTVTESKDENAPNYYTSVQFWVDGKLYATTIDGRIIRFTVGADGTLSDPETFASLLAHNSGPRLVTGFAFDPRSTPDNPILYIPNSALAISDIGGTDLRGAPDFSAKITRISGPKFDQVQDVIVNLPQSYRDHCTNQPVFGPDGAMYVPQPSNTATGGPDEFWDFRKEHLLCATILRIDVDKLPKDQPLDVKTPDVGGTYDPNRPDAPLQIYAKGLRMPYSLLMHSNGRMYAAINGASSGGTTPAGPAAPALPKVSLSEHDWLFEIKKDAYYGHPNDRYGFYVLNGGNPTAAPDFNEVADYPVGVQPDPGWTSAIYDLGVHISANGMTEYKSDFFGPALRGKVFLCRYNVGSDLLCLEFNETGAVRTAVAKIPGTSDMITPLDVECDPKTGNLYVCELTAGRITLLRAVKPVSE